MQEIFTDQVVITSNISKVWDYFVKLEENGSEWLPGITSISKVSDGELGYNSTYHFLARGKKHTSFVSSYEDLRMITLTSVQGNFRANYTYSFREQGNETVVTIEASCEAKGFGNYYHQLLR